jgi:two-component system response regulator HydG
MRLLVLASDSGEGTAAARELSRAGQECKFLTEPNRSTTLFDAVDRAILIHSTIGVLQLGERVEEVRQMVGSRVPLLVCSQQLTPADHRTIVKCGASATVTPRGWSAGEIAERILGECILAGDGHPNHCGSIWGGTQVMRSLYAQIETIAPLSETVLILGETGTGKERVAQELHARSGRAGNLVAVNSAEFTHELLASELFGHERGAFSGAERRREGLLVAAGHGTFFLDEIGDLPAEAQSKLLRVLEEKKVRPVGSNHFEAVHARIILATRRNLEDASDAHFRRDLFERLRGFTLTIPPLRARRADLPLLVSRFLDEYNREYPGTRKIPPQALDPLFRYAWPGNVRELRLAVRQAAAYASGPDSPVSALHLMTAAQRRTAPESRNGHYIPFDPSSESWKQVQDRARARYIRAVLEETGGNKDAAAQRAGLSRSQFYEILKGVGDGAD